MNNMYNVYGKKPLNVENILKKNMIYLNKKDK